MIGILREAHVKKKSKGGRKNSLSIEDMLLMSLEYLREYRTYFHISQSYGISESVCYENIKETEMVESVYWFSTNSFSINDGVRIYLASTWSLAWVKKVLLKSSFSNSTALALVSKF